MARLGLSERVRIAAVQAAGLRRQATAGLTGGRLLHWRAGSGTVRPLDIVPQDVRGADPSFWPEVAGGHFGLSGTFAGLDGRSPFEIPPPNAEWARELHGFGWLRHVEAAGDREAEESVRRWVLAWLSSGCSRTGLPAEPAVRARRVLSLLAHAPMLLTAATPADFDRIGRGLAREVQMLAATWRGAAEGYPRLLALTALVTAHLAVKGEERALAQASARLSAEIARQILPDGGHVSRNPAVLIELLLDWLPLKSCFDARGLEAPDDLIGAIARMLAMLRCLKLGDGGVARFNGMAVGDPGGLATLLAHDDVAASAGAIAPASRYARLQCGDSIVLADAGPPPPLAMSGEAHSGCLSFEMSSGRTLVFVNAGAPGPADSGWRAVSRATASHSTACLGETSSSQLVRHAGLEAAIGAVPLQLPSGVTAQIAQDDDGTRVLAAAHDGYFQRFGLMHERELRLASSGGVLAGIDRLITRNGLDRLKRDVPFAIHFHLHPESECTSAGGTGDGEGTIIQLRDGQRWLFRATGASMGIEESTFFAGSSGPRYAHQIVLRGVSSGSSEVRWSAARLDESDAASGRQETGNSP